MRPKTYYNSSPEPVEIKLLGTGESLLVFRQNIEEVQTEEGGVQYAADEYLLHVPYAENLLDRVETHLEEWLNKAVQEDYEREAAEVRAKRDALLAETDKEMCLDRLGLTSPEGSTFTAWIGFLKTIASAVFGSMAKYRQALRDIPQQEGFPYDVTFPVPPEKGE